MTIFDALPLLTLSLAGRWRYHVQLSLHTLEQSVCPPQNFLYGAQEEALPIWCAFLSKGSSSQGLGVNTENIGLIAYVVGNLE